MVTPSVIEGEAVEHDFTLALVTELPQGPAESFASKFAPGIPMQMQPNVRFPSKTGQS